MAALISPEMGTVTNQAMKMFLNRRQSTDFLERSHPTATTDPTCGHMINTWWRKHNFHDTEADFDDQIHQLWLKFPYLAVSRADRKSDVGRHNDRERRRQLDAEAAEREDRIQDAFINVKNAHEM